VQALPKKSQQEWAYTLLSSNRGNNMTEQKEWKPTKEWLEWYLAPSVDYRKVYGDAFVWTEQEKQLMLLQKLKEQT